MAGEWLSCVQVKMQRKGTGPTLVRCGRCGGFQTGVWAGRIVSGLIRAEAPAVRAGEGGVKLWRGVVVVAVQDMRGDQEQAKVDSPGPEMGASSPIREA